MNRTKDTSPRPVFSGIVAICLLSFALLPQTAHSSEDGRPSAGYKKGFFIQSPDKNFKLVINNRVQTRFSWEVDNGFDELSDDEMKFAIQRARLTMKGHVFNDDIKFKFQTDYGKGSASLKDFYVNFRLTKGLHFRLGQWKRPFSRQYLTSSGKQEFVGRAITDDAFQTGRDVGFALHNNYLKSPTFEWVIGVFNGTGTKAGLSGDVLVDPDTGEGDITSGKFSNVPDQLNPTMVARVGYNHGGIKGYSEADLEGGGVRFSLGASVRAVLNVLDDSRDMELAAQGDFILKMSGLSLSGAFYYDDAQKFMGFHTQLGYVLNKKYQPVLRYARLITPRGDGLHPDGDSNDTQELAGGVSVYFYGHKLKWQTDVGARMQDISGTDGETEYLVRSQLQLAF